MYRPIDPYLNVWMHGSMDRRIGPYFKVEMQGIDGPPNRLTAESFDRGWLLGCFFGRENSVYWSNMKFKACRIRCKKSFVQCQTIGFPTMSVLTTSWNFTSRSNPTRTFGTDVNVRYWSQMRKFWIRHSKPKWTSVLGPKCAIFEMVLWDRCERPLLVPNAPILNRALETEISVHYWSQIRQF